MPSSSMRAVRPKRPWNEIEEKPLLVGSKVLAVLNLDAGFQLCKIQEVSTVYR